MWCGSRPASYLFRVVRYVAASQDQNSLTWEKVSGWRVARAGVEPATFRFSGLGIAGLTDTDSYAVQVRGGTWTARYTLNEHELSPKLSPARANHTAGTCLRAGPLAELSRRHCWAIREHAGEDNSQLMRHLLGRPLGWRRPAR
jgi:hypothetical protein